MRALIQRVSHASVSVDGVVTGEIKNSGILILLGQQFAILKKCHRSGFCRGLKG